MKNGLKIIFLISISVVVISVVVLGGFLKLQNSTDDNIEGGILGGNYNFSLKTDFLDSPTTLPYYRILGEDYEVIGIPHPPEGEILPTEEEAVLIAEKYLESKDMLPEDAVLQNVQTTFLTKFSESGEVLEKIPLDVTITYKREINSLSVVGPGDEITVSVGKDKEVFYCFKSWRIIEQVGEINIINPEEAYNKLLEGKTIRIPLITPQSSIEIYEISFGYYAYPHGQPQEFYKPVWIFYGKIVEREEPIYFAVEACD